MDIVLLSGMILIACVAIVEHRRANRETHWAKQWKTIAQKQGEVIESQKTSLETQGAALDRLMRATDEWRTAHVDLKTTKAMYDALIPHRSPQAE